MSAEAEGVTQRGLHFNLTRGVCAVVERALRILILQVNRRWNDTIATVTDQESIDFATENLADVGWQRGKHIGDESEQRKAHPLNMGWIEKTGD